MTRIFQSNALLRPDKRDGAESSARRHMYNYRDGSNVENSDWEFVVSPPDDNNDKDLSDAKVVE